MISSSKKLVVCDLDNTLYDWVSYFVPSFYAMVDTAVEILDCDKDRLLDDLKIVHQEHHDSEHPFSLLEAETVRNFIKSGSRKDILEALQPAFRAFNSTRKKTLKAYPGVVETLTALDSNGVTLVAHTESTLFSAVDRLKRLNLERFFTRIYCRIRSATPHPYGLKTDEWLSIDSMKKIVELSHHQRKPDPTVLLEIGNSLGFKAKQIAYIGDSMARDILMAKKAGVYSIWAKYGIAHPPGYYEKLVRVSHWTNEDVIREKRLNELSLGLDPSFTANHSFSDLLETPFINT